MHGGLLLLAQLLTGALLGAMLFFSFGVAPVVLGQLPAEWARPLLRAIRKVHGWACGTLALVAGLAAWGRMADTLLLIVAAGFAGALAYLMPRIDADRDAGIAGDARAARRLARLHRLSLALDLAQMALVLLAFVLLGA
jgi:hypothetical protein